MRLYQSNQLLKPSEEPIDICDEIESASQAQKDFLNFVNRSEKAIVQAKSELVLRQRILAKFSGFLKDKRVFTHSQNHKPAEVEIGAGVKSAKEKRDVFGIKKVSLNLAQYDSQPAKLYDHSPARAAQ